MPDASLVRFGTSSWAYEGWQGLVYKRSYPKGRFKHDCLAEYARFEFEGQPLFKTVGFDFTFYRPPTHEQLAHYAAQLPPGFQVCSKVWEEIEQVIAPYAAAFSAHTGPFLFEFQRSGIEQDDFLRRLDSFLGRLPKEYDYAVEVRHATLLRPDYHAILRSHQAAHVYNHWTHMPPLAEQHRRLNQAFTAPFVVLRLLTPSHPPRPIARRSPVCCSGLVNELLAEVAR